MVAHRRTSGERDPQLPPDLDLRTLPRAVRAELRGLTMEAADFVGGHLVMAGQLVDTDPELAFAHAEAARRRAARLPIVREASAETAYAAGEYVHALSEYRALRRMTGNDEYLPVMADCERALGRHQDALDLAREAKHAGLGPDLVAEALMVEAGVREDMGQAAEGLRLLKSATRVPVRGLSKGSRARLAYAYADLLLRTGDETEAVGWFTTAADLDTEGVTDADERLARLQGMVLELDDAGIEGWAPEEEDEDDGPGADGTPGDRVDDLEDDGVAGDDDDSEGLGGDSADSDLDDVDEDDEDATDEPGADLRDRDVPDADELGGDLTDLEADEADEEDTEGLAGGSADSDVLDRDAADEDDSVVRGGDLADSDVLDADGSDQDDPDELGDDLAGPDLLDAAAGAATPADDSTAEEDVDEDTAELGDRVTERVYRDGGDTQDDLGHDEQPGADDDVDGLGGDVADRVFGDDADRAGDVLAGEPVVGHVGDVPSAREALEERSEVQGTDRAAQEPGARHTDGADDELATPLEEAPVVGDGEEPTLFDEAPVVVGDGEEPTPLVGDDGPGGDGTSDTGHADDAELDPADGPGTDRVDDEPTTLLDETPVVGDDAPAPPSDAVPVAGDGEEPTSQLDHDDESGDDESDDDESGDELGDDETTGTADADRVEQGPADGPGTDRADEEPATLLDEVPAADDDQAPTADGDEEPKTLLDDDVPSTTGEDGAGSGSADRDGTQQ